MKEDEPTFDEYRTGYIAARWDLPENAAKALQLFELGYSISGAAKYLPVTEGTVRSYHKRLQETIAPAVVYPVTGDRPRFDVFGKSTLRHKSKHEWGKGEGHAHGVEARNRAANERVTESEEEVGSFRERTRPLNKGIAFDEINDALITIKG